MTRSNNKYITFRSRGIVIRAILLICLGISFNMKAYSLPNQSLFNAQNLTVIKHYDKGFSPLFRVYLTDVLKAALDKSVMEYGPYKIQFHPTNLSTNRSKIETERGVLLDVLFASHWSSRYTKEANVIPVQFPIFNGMLGLRSLIVTKDMDDVFSTIQSGQELKQYIAGQGADWEDVKILKSNQIPVMEAQHFDALFPMLSKNRYDYLPLSTLEVQTALRTKGVSYNNLMVNEEVGIFYPLPFYLYVNARRPHLAKRIERGLQIATEDGTIERLFDKHFGSTELNLQAQVKKLVILNNALISRDKNQEYIKEFLDKYQDSFDVIKD